MRDPPTEEADVLCCDLIFVLLLLLLPPLHLQAAPPKPAPKPAAKPTHSLQPYLDAVRATLTAAMCLENFSSQIVERHNKPEVEVRCVLNQTLFF